MRLLAPTLFVSLICSAVWGQKLTPDSNYILNNTIFTTTLGSKATANTFLGSAPFWPHLVRKVPIGHPEGAIGIGLTQQYKPNPHPYRWQNEFWMQPLFGLPQYPNFVLHEVSPTLSRFTNPTSMQALSTGQLDGNRFNKQFRQVKFVQGFPFRK